MCHAQFGGGGGEAAPPAAGGEAKPPAEGGAPAEGGKPPGTPTEGGAPAATHTIIVAPTMGVLRYGESPQTLPRGSLLIALQFRSPLPPQRATHYTSSGVPALTLSP